MFQLDQKKLKVNLLGVEIKPWIRKTKVELLLWLDWILKNNKNWKRYWKNIGPLVN